MSHPPQVPAALRAAVERDLAPVRPLRSPGARALEVALWAVALLVVVPALAGVRQDARLLGLALSWGAAVLEVVAGLLLVWMALREAVPGRGASRAGGAAALLAAALVLAGVAVLTWAHAPVAAPLSDAALHGAECFSLESAFGIPALLLTLWLVVRAFPVRPAWAGLLGGTGAGLLADGAQHLVCGIPNLDHVLVWHGGAVVFLALLGFVLGRVWERFRLARRR